MNELPPLPSTYSAQTLKSIKELENQIAGLRESLAGELCSVACALHELGILKIGFTLTEMIDGFRYEDGNLGTVELRLSLHEA